MLVTAYDAQQASLLSRYCPQTDGWNTSKAYDVTGSRGCPAAMIDVNMHERDILRVDSKGQRVRLYLGQRPTGEHLGKQQHVESEKSMERPTSFQPPLIECDTIDGVINSINKNSNNALLKPAKAAFQRSEPSYSHSVINNNCFQFNVFFVLFQSCVLFLIK